jgi:hypothetical protein
MIYSEKINFFDIDISSQAKKKNLFPPEIILGPQHIIEGDRGSKRSPSPSAENTLTSL